jgi:hypothetical protein
MPLGDYITPTVDRFWAILEADATWVAKVPTGLRLGRYEGPDERRQMKGSGDKVECEIRPVGGTNAQTWTRAGSPVTFGGWSAAGPCELNAETVVNYEIKYTFRDLDYTNATLLYCLTEKLLLLSGPRFVHGGSGLDYVKSWGLSFRFNEDDPEKKGSDRVVLRIPIAVTYDITKARLTS